MKKSKVFSAILATLMFSAFSGYTSAETTTEIVNPQNVSAPAVSFGLFSYKDDDALIKTVRTIEKLGYQSNVAADSLSLSNYQGSVIIFTPESGDKALLPGDALGAFGYNMKPKTISVQDALVIRNTPTGVNGLGTVIKQSYGFIYDGQHSKASQEIVIPENGVAVTLEKLSDGKLLVITAVP